MSSSRRASRVSTFAFAILLCMPPGSASALPQWTWLGGAKTPNAIGVYTSPGQPGARELAENAVDASDRLYLFGGFGYGTAQVGYLSDLWRHDGAQWTCLSGTSARNGTGTYVAIGSPGVPCARRGGAMWVDSLGDVWLFGGEGYGTLAPPLPAPGPLNDLWRFSAGTWTWMGGSKFVGDSGSTSYPGARTSCGAVLDSAGTLWLFGGTGLRVRGPVNEVVSYGDLWSFDGTSWTLRSGPLNDGSWGSYGTRGVAAASNRPGGRSGCALFRRQGGGLWMYGGSGFDAGSGNSTLNDLWRFDGSLWTWVSGSEFCNRVGSYGALGVPSPLNEPPSRARPVAWADVDDHVWVFGGGGNALWVFDGDWWTWVSGSKFAAANGVYGTLGVPAPANVPGNRTNMVAWYTPSLGARLFGGNGRAEAQSGLLNDLWSVQLEMPVRVGMPPTVEFVLAPAEGDTVNYVQRFRWAGSDLDGTVDHFLYAIDPGVAQPDTYWVQTTATTQTIFFLANVPAEPLPAVGPFTFLSPHTLVLKSVDNDGLESAPLARHLAASNLAPDAWINSPQPDSTRAVTSLDQRITWQGLDADGYFTDKPVKYKFRLFLRNSPFPLPTLDLVQFLRTYPDSLARLFAPEFAGWDSLSADSAFVQFSHLTPQQEYVFCVVGIDEAGAYTPRFKLDRNALWFQVPIWSAVDGARVPLALEFDSPRPNPTRLGSEVRFALPREGPARIVIYDALGRRIRTLVDATFQPGVYRAVWNLEDGAGRRVPAGLYFLRLEADREARTHRVAVTR